MYIKYIAIVSIVMMISINPMIASSTYSPNLAERQQIQNITETIDSRIDWQMQIAQQYFLFFERLNTPRELVKYNAYEQYLINQISTHLLGTYIKPLPKVDVNTDSSPTKFVSSERPYTNIYYIPNWLVTIADNANIYRLGGTEIQMRADVYDDLQEMAKAFRTHMWYKMTLTSGYRSFTQQQLDFTLECKQSKKCAYEGTSEHQSWLAIDIWGMRWLAYEWMVEHAHTYGFHQSYQNGIEIDGYQREDRHWRHLGRDLATELYQKWITFTQWVREEERE